MINFLIFSCNKKADYKYMGEFNYVIENQSDFENTYLSDSYGYVVSDLDIPGLKIIGIEDLTDNKDYVVVYNHPAESILTNSKKIREEGVNMKRKPIEVIVNKNTKKEKVYIYQLDKKDTYRLLLP
jgi:CO dehydrogenase nickel-insertion accessory protein CooC1